MRLSHNPIGPGRHGAESPWLKSSASGLGSTVVGVRNPSEPLRHAAWRAVGVQSASEAPVSAAGAAASAALAALTSDFCATVANLEYLDRMGTSWP